MSKINDDLKEEIHKFLHIYAKAIAKRAADKFTADAKASIEEFYLDYQPKFYNRTFDLLENSYKRFYQNKERYYFGGVIISPEKMQDYKTSRLLSQKQTITKKEDVFKWTWYEGFHGYHWGMKNGSKWINPIQSQPPISRLLERYNDKAFFEDLKKTALSEARKEHYKYLKF